MRRHSSPKNSGTAKYVLIGMLFLILAGSSYLVMNTFFAQQQERTPSVKKQASVKTHPSISKVETSTEVATSNSSVQQSSESELQPAVTALKENAEQVYYGVHYFKQSKDISSNNSAPTTAASVIKVFIMEYALTQAEPSEVIQGKPLNDWLVPMIQQSDNEAANVLMDHFGMEELNAFFHAKGYMDTRLERRMLDDEARSQGKENYTSLNDCLAFLKQLYQQRETYPQSIMFDIMKGQTLRTKIPSKLPVDSMVANKTGELDDTENDIGLVLSEMNPFAIVVLTKNFKSVEGIRTAIGEFALAATETDQ